MNGTAEVPAIYRQRGLDGFASSSSSPPVTDDLVIGTVAWCRPG
jgi:hypothetical protein